MQYGRKLIRFTSLIFILAGLILLFSSKDIFPNFYNPAFMGISSLFSAFIIMVPELVLRSETKLKNDAIIIFQLGLTLAIILNGLGSLGMYQLFEWGFQYDKLTHFLSSMVLGFVFANVLAVWRDMNIKKIIYAVLLSGIATGLAWEILELAFDLIFKTKTLGLNGNYVTWDSSVDIVMNMLGIFVALCIFWYYYNKKLINKKI